MDWDLAKFALEAALAGVGGFIGVRVAVVTLQTQVKYIEKAIEDDRRIVSGLREVIYEHGDRIAVIEEKIGLNYRG